ncbi:MAG TPA: winged helix DNA-binding domain-containing protein [Gemmatimonadaceae bacterium]|nr:winged helix DNA-binding domain-containing protein [Gemmatimonadaceae bacterium]
MDVRRTRLSSQHISRSTFDDPADVVRSFGAVQAQDYLGALWALGLRSKAATEASVEATIARRAVIRTWPMRGTLHLVAADDVRWMLPLLTPRVIVSTTGRFRSLGLDAAVFARSARVTEKALAGGTPVRRDALYEIWNTAGIDTRESRGLHILGYLAQTGLICFGPRDGKQHTFVLLEAWLPASPTLSRDEALGALALRYFTSHGPASVHDFSWWSGLTVTDARAGIESVKAELESETIEKRTLWFRPASATRAGFDNAYLLPAWDEYTVAYRDRLDVLDARYATRVNAGGGVLKPVVVIRGEVVGSWGRTLAKGRVLVRPSLFKHVAQADWGAIEKATVKYGRFLGLPAELAKQA